jgi:AcrR family transcriptional regulator
VGTSQRPPLSRERIVVAAVEYADENGLTALTMRRLGELLGVEAMSLYSHVNGREDLLEAMVDHVVRQVRVPGDSDLGPTNGWQAFLQHIAHQVRSVAVRHPNLFPVVATRPPGAPWLRPPLRSLEMVEGFLQGLTRRGLPGEQSVHVYKVFTSFLLGHLLLEVAVRGAETGLPEEPIDEGSATVPNTEHDDSLDRWPTVASLRPQLEEHDPAREFEQALEVLLDRLDRELAQ